MISSMVPFPRAYAQAAVAGCPLCVAERREKAWDAIDHLDPDLQAAAITSMTRLERVHPVGPRCPKHGAAR